MKILLTGNQGLIGRAITPYLQRTGFEITGYDLVNGEDIHDITKLAGKLQGKQACIHLAGIPRPTPDPWEDFLHQNIKGTQCVIEACNRVRVKRLVYMSSGAVYGFSKANLCRPERFPIREDNVKPDDKDDNYYAISKRICEKHLERAAHKHNMTTIALRMDTPTGRKTRDYPCARPVSEHFYVSISRENMAEGVRAACEADYQGFGVFNIADPVVPIERAGNVDIQGFIQKRYPRVPNFTKGNQSLFDITKAKQLLGYNPK